MKCNFHSENGGFKMHCLNCSFYNKNDSINAFGTCEPQAEDFHCAHECNLSIDEVREIEGLVGHKREQINL